MIINQTITIGEREYKIKGIEETDKLAIYLSKSDYLLPMSHIIEPKTVHSFDLSTCTC